MMKSTPFRCFHFHAHDRQPHCPVYLGLVVYAEKPHSLGMSIFYDRVMQLFTALGNYDQFYIDSVCLSGKSQTRHIYNPGS